MIAMDPQQTVDFWLTLDEHKPPLERPTFTTRYLTARQVTQAQRLADEALDAERDGAREKWESNCVIALALGLTGWRNIQNGNGKPVAFDPQRLPELLTDYELIELPYRMIGAVRLAEIDRKKSSLPSPNGTDAAALSGKSGSNAEVAAGKQPKPENVAPVAAGKA